MTKRGMLIVVSGPSGSGKGTVVKRLRELCPDIALSVSATTRPPRESVDIDGTKYMEKDGVHYYFVSRSEFEDSVAHGEMLEHTVYLGNYYGTPKREAERILDSGRDLILEIEVDGGSQIKNMFPDAVTVMLIPPSAEVLASRLRSRNSESDDKVAARLLRAKEELRLLPTYDYAVVNEEGKIDACAEDILAIIKAEHSRSRRMCAILDNFG